MNNRGRNTHVEAAVTRALERIDYFINGGTIKLPDAKYRRAAESLLDTQAASVKTAALFLMFYWLEQSSWDLKAVPRGIRGQYGDKRLSEELNRRSITLHNRITAFGEDLGWKGDVSQRDISTDTRFSSFISAIADAEPPMRAKLADFFAQKFAESKRELSPLPPIGGCDMLTFVRAKILFHDLLCLPSEGHVQQFLIAALLSEYRLKQGIEVRTYHPHSADEYNRSAGDIEEVLQDTVIRAYEVTMRPDWKNRLSNFRDKMDHFALNKYIIIAAGVNSDESLSEPARMALLIEPHGRDIAIVDIQDVVHFLAAELSMPELRNAVNKAYEYLTNPTLSGRDDLKIMYRDAVRNWLDATEEKQTG
jgi:hypothetical protein